MDEKSQGALLFIPDISGFTQFVHEMEISHSQHIIQELLECLLDSNELGMKVSEVEGDAIFFYKLGSAPSPDQLLEQAKKMFLSFHRHLRQYDVSRICDCGACTGASRLTLKIVAHHGNVTFYKVKEYEKLFGSDVILIHRLLKNEITDHEYLLATESLPIHQVKEKDKFDWLDIKEGRSLYDVGEIRYLYTPLKGLYSQVHEPLKPAYKIYRSKNPVSISVDIQASVDKVWNIITDLPKRLRMPGMKEVNVKDEAHNRINKLGTQHVCVSDHQTSEAITTDFEVFEGGGRLTETDPKHPISFDYIVEDVGGKTRLTMKVHVCFKFPMSLLFEFLKKKGAIVQLQAGLNRFKEICEEGNEVGHKHHIPAH